jgi:two-component system sensor histidine kinase KdpD
VPANGASPYDHAVRQVRRGELVTLLAVAIPSLAGATAVVALLQFFVGVPNASSVYLLAVVATAFAAGALGAVVASIASFLLYDFLFVQPTFTFTIADAGEWLNLALLLFVGIVVGELTALQRQRTVDARERAREARALFRVSRRLATRASTMAVLRGIAEGLCAETAMDRVWIALGPDDAGEAIAADSSKDPRPTLPASISVLKRTPGDEPAEWVRVHRQTVKGRATSVGRTAAAEREAYRIRIEAAGEPLGSIWSVRSRGHGGPTSTETRLLSSAADQIGQALAQDRLAAESQAAEVARQSDELKSALLQSVSHDLRTPLATIRAAAGTLRPGSDVSVPDQQASVEAIDREVEYLNRLVTNLLDLSRIEAGVLRADRDVFPLDDLVERTVGRSRGRVADRTIEVQVPDEAVEVDPIFFDESLGNVLDNALKYTPADARILVSARAVTPALVRLTIEDSGPGVPQAALNRLFEKFYRVDARASGSRSGTGIGLAVVRGLVEAMGGSVRARRSELGGLAVDLDLPRARMTPAAAPASADGTAASAESPAGTAVSAESPAGTPASTNVA